MKFEIHVFSQYLLVLNYLRDNLYKMSTLEKDLELLASKSEMCWMYRMAIVYRSEKKLILQSQIHIIRKVLSILEFLETMKEESFDGPAYTNELMEKTIDEREWFDTTVKGIKTVKEDYFYRRLINA